MAKKDLSLEPQSVCDGLWYYEDNDGLHVVINWERLHPIDNDTNTKHVKIPWRKIRASLNRKDRLKE